MPLSKRARIEIYLPDRKVHAYRRLQRAFENEFLHTFGGCTVIKDTKGLYTGFRRQSRHRTRINLVYADTPFDFDENFEASLEIY